MLFTVLILSGTLLAVTVIAGILTVYQIRASSDSVRSTQALYAADAGIEQELYRWFKDNANCHQPLPSNPATIGIYPTNPSCFRISLPLGNGATFTTSVSYQAGVAIPGNPPITTIQTMRSTGQSVNSVRAFRADF